VKRSGKQTDKVLPPVRAAAPKCDDTVCEKQPEKATSDSRNHPETILLAGWGKLPKANRSARSTEITILTRVSIKKFTRPARAAQKGEEKGIAKPVSRSQRRKSLVGRSARNDADS
jgi:hypothetical protein